MKLLHRLKRGVAPALQALSAAAGRRRRPTAGERPNSVASAPTAFRRTLAEVTALAWPIAVGMLGETAIGLVDTKLVAGLGAEALGGVGIGVTLMYLNYAVVFGIMRGVKVRVSHAIGAGRPEDGVRYMKAGALIALVTGVAIWFAARDVTWALHGLGVDEKTVVYARDFLAARTWGAPAVCVLSAMIQYRQAIGDTRTPMLIGLFGNVLNAGLAWALIYGRFGLPALGVRGAGYGTAVAESLEVAIMLVILAREARARTRSGCPASQLGLRSAAREVATLGVPTGLQFGFEMLAFTAFTAIIGGIGANEIAGHQLALSIIRVSFLPGVAVAEAASVMVGRALGRALENRANGDSSLAEADRVVRSSLLLAVSFMTACGVIFGFGGGVIARAFIDDPPVARLVTRLLYVAAIFQALDAVTIVLRGALRGAKDVRAVAIIGITVAWVCIPGAAYVFGMKAGMGALGGWFGFVGETTLAATLFYRRWTKGAWRKGYASPAEEKSVTYVKDERDEEDDAPPSSIPAIA